MAPTVAKAVKRRASEYDVKEICLTYADLELPSDGRVVSAAEFAKTKQYDDVGKKLFSPKDEENPVQLDVYESITTKEKVKKKRNRKVPDDRDRAYRSDREFLKRNSHRRMIWFFRKLKIRHPAALRTHLEKVKHPEFELPHLQCVFPHAELSAVLDDHRTNRNEAGTSTTYYQLYCPTDSLVQKVKNALGDPHKYDQDYKKMVLTCLADIIGRMLWHNNRTHTVLFAKSDHFDRDCFILYGRQAEPAPYMMRSDSYFCRRYDTEKFKLLAPQPDLTRAHTQRMTNESSIYVVGCNIIELWKTFPYDYRLTQCRPMKSICEQIKLIDPEVLAHAFSFVNKHVNGCRIQSPYVEVAARTSFDICSALLRDGELSGLATDDSVAYRSFVERFILCGILNVNSIFKIQLESLLYGGYRDDNSWWPSSDRLDQIVLHHVNYRREIRELRTNRVFYYRNAYNLLCSLSLLDNFFEDHTTYNDPGERGEKNRNVVFFFDLLEPFKYAGSCHRDINHMVFHVWDDVETMIHESSYTINRHLTRDVLNASSLPHDPFYPKSDMSPLDLAVDHMLERAVKHSKCVKLPTCKSRKKKNDKSKAETDESDVLARRFKLEKDAKSFTDAVATTLSKAGEDRLREGYLSPRRPSSESDDGADGRMREMVRVEYGSRPRILVDEHLVSVYVLDSRAEVQVRLTKGANIIDKRLPEYIQLANTDRVIRVFAIQADTDAYTVRPYVYFIFRGMPIAIVDEDLLRNTVETAASFEKMNAFGVFEELHDQYPTDVGSVQQVKTPPPCQDSPDDKASTETPSLLDFPSIDELLSSQPTQVLHHTMETADESDETLRRVDPMSIKIFSSLDEEYILPY